MFKPAPEPHQYVPNSQRAALADAVLIAAHDWYIPGPAAAGQRTAFISRDGQVSLPASTSLAIAATSLQAIATELMNP